MGYFKDTLKGISWMTALRGFTRGLAVVKIAILARILVPAQFGNYAIALLVLGFLEILTETGINVFLIQEKDDTKSYLDSAWVVSIIRGILVTLIILASAPLVVYFFNAPAVLHLLYLIAGVAFIRGFINPMEVTYQKKLQFKNEFLFQAFLYLVDAGTAVTIGIATHSESAMIISMMIAATFEVILSFVLFKDRPRLSFEKEKFFKVIKSGKWITGAGIFSYIFQNIDNVTVGKLLGTTNLGFYQQAYSISTLPVSEVGQIFNKVTFPVFVGISEDVERLKKAFFKTLAVIVAMVIPFAIIILFFSKPIILIVLGAKWLSIEPVLKILAFFGVLKAILNFSYSLFLSLKLQKYVMYSELMGIIGMGIAIYPMTLKYGIVGAGISTIIAFICSLPVVIFGLKKIFRW
jgi:O-antigen/teichoic acid export membrane protein